MKNLQRFGFGKNWQDFIHDVDEERVLKAEQSLRALTGMSSFAGKNFLDVGCGSGLFSLAARRLGARVTSFDFDTNSVSAARSLKERFLPADNGWVIGTGDVLDRQFMSEAGQYDMVYSWGVLHHTGDMNRAFDNVVSAVRPGGVLCIAIYNDEGRYSKMWLFVKRMYNRMPGNFFKYLLVALVAFSMELRLALARLLSFRNPLPAWKQRNRQSLRGMSVWYDYVDWVGGLPFEVSRPDVVFRFFHDRGFELINMTTVGRGHGCNEYVFRLRANEGLMHDPKSYKECA